MKNVYQLTLAVSVMLLTACGGNVGGSTTQTGQFIDDPVGGLTYTCSNGTQTNSGITGPQGEFKYINGQACTFSVGKVTLGTLQNIPSDGKVTPQDVAGVLRTATDAPSAVAIAQFLQTLNDGSTTGKIVIPPATTAAFNASDLSPVTLAASTGAISQSELSNLVTAVIPTKTLVSPTSATANLNTQMTLNNISTTTGAVSASAPVVLNSISVTSSSNNNPAGLSENLTALGYYSDGTVKDITRSVTWSSSDTNTLIVANSVATGKKAGNASVIASLTPSGSSNKISGSTIISTASPVVSSIAITNSNSLPAGLTDQLTATATLTDGSTTDFTSAVTWSSSDTTKATVGATSGLVQGLVKGTSSITASYATGTPITASFTETIIDPTILNLVISYVQSGISSLFTTTTTALQAILNYSDQSTKTVSSEVQWTVSPSSSVTISNNPNTANDATLTAGSPGRTTISASYNNVNSNQLSLVVADLPKAQFIDDPVVGLAYGCSSSTSQTSSGYTDNQGLFSYLPGQTCTFSVGKVTLGTLKNIPSDGKVTPQDVAGVVRLATGVPSAVAIAQFLQTINDGSTTGKIVIPTATTTAFNASSVTPVTLAAPSGAISQSDLSNLVTTVIPTKTLVSATSATANLNTQMTQNNISTSSGAVSASAPVVLNSISVTSSSNNNPAGLTANLTAMGYYSDGTTKDITSNVTWSSSDTNTLLVVNAVATGKKAGYASIIATLTPSGSTTAISGSTIITTAAPVVSSIAITNSNSLPAGLTDQLTATATLTDGSKTDVTSSVTWSSSDTTKATVGNTSGLVKGLVKGTSTITASYSTGTPITATYAETILDPTILNLVISYVQSGISSVSYMGTIALQAIVNLSDSTYNLVSSMVNWTVSSLNGGAGTVTKNTSLNSATLTGTISGNTSISANYSGFTSNNLALTILPPPPTITSHPSATSIYEKSNATFNVTGTSEGAISYQWKKNGVIIIGATNSSYTLNSAAISDNNSIFTVDLTNSFGTTTSAPATLTVLQLAPSIITAPSSQTIVAGQTARFSVTAAGYPTLSYQWYKNGNTITGATNSSYSTPVTLSDTGSSYSVSVTNSTNTISSSSATLTVQQSNLNDLVISEVSTCYYFYVDCWFEIHNPTAIPININQYTIRSISLNVTTSTYTTGNYTLPSTTIPSDGYLIISGNYNNVNQVGSQDIKLRNGSLIPQWSSSGFIEILKAGATVDFVKFGTDSRTPTTSATYWNGTSVAALPSSSTDYGKSIVRAFPRTVDTNTRSASDWTSVNWTTPAGRNDIPADAVDNDLDGIPDSAEIAGGTFSGIDLYAMGARTNQKDIFIEADQMNSTDAGIVVRKEALQKVVSAFAAKTISIHIDAGTSFNSNFSTQDFNLGQGSNKVTYEKCVSFDQTTCSTNLSSRRSLWDWKNESMDLRRRSIFHYALFGNSQNTNGTSGSSGIAELPGNDLIVTLGSWGLSTTTTSNLNVTINFQASTLMHELGHNLGLHHGGFENVNYKPNYWSVMNYTYQIYGLDPDAKSITAYQRWRLAKGDNTPTMCSLVSSPCDSPDLFVMSYSDGTSSDLIESALLESANIGRGSNTGAYADWNLNGVKNITSISKDLTGDAILSTLKDYNDWNNLAFPFYRNGGDSKNNGILLNKSSQTTLNPISNDKQPISDICAPMPSMLQ